MKFSAAYVALSAASAAGFALNAPPPAFKTSLDMSTPPGRSFGGGRPVGNVGGPGPRTAPRPVGPNTRSGIDRRVSGPGVSGKRTEDIFDFASTTPV
eukprot:CAMPEP_0197432024 /NCGR_PEP_ID=MMETSP1175-20131217/162_1 /TAXON_ID=1003142 /ORGANISM="Triceratium dubium, Strain CCMP147" /LENGTH=96 /DNA_ID=CAMNT_0042960011 /DNA_START=137 /DNA_END=423 /DNA_ORIENTATION=-